MAAPRGTLEDQAAEAHHRSHRQSSGAYVAAIPVAKGFPGKELEVLLAKPVLFPHLSVCLPRASARHAH
jgi:hypothetical protein